MDEKFSRTEMMFGKEAMQKLASSRVAVFGAGGVGGYAIEALARSGIGSLDIIDNDKISVTNINRQILATVETVGRFKTEVAAERIKKINPDCTVTEYKIFYLPETPFNFKDYDYIIDAIDTVSGKIAIVRNAAECGVPVISCMGAGNKLDATAFEVADISKTSVCPLAKVMRRELKKYGITNLKVVYSKEEPVKPCGECVEEGSNKRAVPASNAFVPSVAGLIIAGEVIKDLINR